MRFTYTLPSRKALPAYKAGGFISARPNDGSRCPSRKVGRGRRPSSNWECVFVDDLGAPAQLCQMCETQEIRYVHHMQHAGFPTILEVGCICAGHMEGDYLRAKTREDRLKKAASRRKRWPFLKAWTTSQNGNPMIRKYGYRVTIFKGGSLWSGVIVDENNKKLFAKKSYQTELAAKLAAFNGIMWLQNKPR